VVQILVVVANIQARTLKAEAEKGFSRTAFGRELIDPKSRINLEERTVGSPRLFLRGGSGGSPLDASPRRKGIGFNVPESGFGYSLYGDVRELGDVGRRPGKSSLFFLTAETSLEPYRTEKGSDLRQSVPIYGASGAPRSSLENPRERIIFEPVRTHNRIGSPRFEASGR